MVGIAVSIGLFLVAYLMKTLPIALIVFLSVVGGLLFVIGMLGLTGVWNRLFGKTSSSSNTNTQELKLIYNLKTGVIGAVAIEQAQRTGKISPIERIEHAKRPSTISSVLWIGFFSGWIIVGLAGIGSWIFAKTPTHFTLSSTLAPLFLLAVSIYILVDIFRIRRKYYRINRSSTVKDADFIIDGNINYILDICHRNLLTMNATERKKKSPNLFKAQLGKSKVTIEVMQTKDHRVNVYVVSDAHYWTARYDDGNNNQNNINTFTKLLYHSIWESTMGQTRIV